MGRMTPAKPMLRRSRRATSEPPPGPRHAPAVSGRALALMAACTALALLASSDALHASLITGVAWVDGVVGRHPLAGGALFVALAALSAMLSFFSSAALVPVAVYAWGQMTCAVLLWLGWVVGGAAAYAIGRFLAGPMITSLMSRAARGRYEGRISRRTPFLLVLLFQLALPSEIPGYVLGVARYSFGRYLLALALAELPFAAGTVYLGASLLERRMLELVLVGALGALVIVVALHTLHQRLFTAHSGGPQAQDAG
jgi:uncharacterized membrane protein YdjX (TVP38/TMEM64 family)